MKKDKTPLYPYPHDRAKQYGEEERYWASRKSNLLCKETIEAAISEHYGDNRLDSKAAVDAVVGQFGFDRVLFILANTVRQKEHDGRISCDNKEWAKTVPVYDDFDHWGRNRNFELIVDRPHTGLTDLFLREVRHQQFLATPIKAADIHKEALRICCQFENAPHPNSPDGKHFMVEISPDFLARAKVRDTERLVSILPHKSLHLTVVEQQKGLFAFISRDENRHQLPLKRKPSIRDSLAQVKAAPKPPSTGKSREPER